MARRRNNNNNNNGYNNNNSWNNNNNNNNNQNKPKCANCPNSNNHWTKDCNKNKKQNQNQNQNPCNGCGRTGHRFKQCPDRWCNFCAIKGSHWETDCKKKNQQNAQTSVNGAIYSTPYIQPSWLAPASNSLVNVPQTVPALYDTLMNQVPVPINDNNRSLPHQLQAEHQLNYNGAIFRPAPAQPEEIWCKWCNSLSHNTVGCKNRTQQYKIEFMYDTISNLCTRCAYKGHPGNLCCNPSPEARCWLCNRPGHSEPDCLRHGAPEFHEVLGLAQSRSLLKAREEESSKKVSKSATAALKRKAAQAQEAWKFVDNLVYSSGGKTDEEIHEVPSDDMLDIMPGVLAHYKGKPALFANVDLSATVAQMQWLHNSDNWNFWQIGWALHRLQAGYTIHCGFRDRYGQVCKGGAGIVDHQLREVTSGSHHNYDLDQPVHAVFLAFNCQHDNWTRTMLWKKSRTVEADLTSLNLLKAAHEDKVFTQYVNSRWGLLEAMSAEDEEEEEDNKDKKTAAQVKAEEAARLRQLENEIRREHAAAYQRAQALQQSVNYYNPTWTATGFGITPNPINTAQAAAQKPCPYYSPTMELSTPIARKQPHEDEIQQPPAPSSEDHQAENKPLTRADIDQAFSDYMAGRINEPLTRVWRELGEIKASLRNRSPPPRAVGPSPPKKASDQRGDRADRQDRRDANNNRPIRDGKGGRGRRGIEDNNGNGEAPRGNNGNDRPPRNNGDGGEDRGGYQGNNFDPNYKNRRGNDDGKGGNNRGPPPGPANNDDEIL